MIELLEHLIEQDFEDVFEPVSDEEVLKRRAAIIQKALDSDEESATRLFDDLLSTYTPDELLEEAGEWKLDVRKAVSDIISYHFHGLSGHNKRRTLTDMLTEIQAKIKDIA
jgi:hypothetical protein